LADRSGLYEEIAPESFTAPRPAEPIHPHAAHYESEGEMTNPKSILAVAIAGSILAGGVARADEPREDRLVLAEKVPAATLPNQPPRPLIAPLWQPTAATAQRWSQPRPESLIRGIIGGVIGGVGGFYLGGVVGAGLQPACWCDDPGLTGFLIGAPIGTVAGAIIGAKVASR
jgi:hypothetical protein